MHQGCSGYLLTGHIWLLSVYTPMSEQPPSHALENVKQLWEIMCSSLLTVVVYFSCDITLFYRRKHKDGGVRQEAISIISAMKSLRTQY